MLTLVKDSPTMLDSRMLTALACLHNCVEGWDMALYLLFTHEVLHLRTFAVFIPGVQLFRRVRCTPLWCSLRVQCCLCCCTVYCTFHTMVHCTLCLLHRVQALLPKCLLHLLLDERGKLFQDTLHL